MRFYKVIFSVLVLLGLLGVAGCSSGSSRQALIAGTAAPVFNLENLEGQTVALDSFRGKPVLLNFFATWCGPCRGEMPYLQNVAENPEWQAEGLIVLAVDLGETSEKVQEFIDANGYTFIVLLDPKGAVGGRYNVSGIPTTYFINEDGIIENVRIGAFMNELDIHKILADMVLKDSR